MTVYNHSSDHASNNAKKIVRPILHGLPMCIRPFFHSLVDQTRTTRAQCSSLSCANDRSVAGRAAMEKKRPMPGHVCSSAAKRCAKRGAFLSPREYLAKFEGLIRNGPERRSAAAVAQAEARVRYEMTLSAAAIREANKQLQDPIRIRLSMDIDDHGVARPCSRCSLHMDTAFVKATDRCTACDQDFCHTCLRQHAALCRWPGTASTEGMKAAADDSTAFESSGESDSEADFSDISVE